MFQKLLERIALALLEQKIPYMVIGGQAVLLYGEPRLTRDIDITLGTGVKDLHKIVKISENLGFHPLVKNIDDFVIDTMVFPVIDEKSGIRIDFMFSFSPYERQAIERSRRIRIGRTEVRFAALEDIVIHKMVAERARDIEDAKAVLLKNPDFDAGYIRKWLSEFDRSLGTDFQESFEELIKYIKSD